MPGLEDQPDPMERLKESLDSSRRGGVDCSLVLTVGDMAIRLECTCAPGSERSASNVLMEDMRARIVAANNRRLAGLPPVPEASTN